MAILSAAICVTMFALGFGVLIPISGALSSFADLVGVASAMVVLGPGFTLRLAAQPRLRHRVTRAKALSGDLARRRGGLGNYSYGILLDPRRQRTFCKNRRPNGKPDKPAPLLAAGSAPDDRQNPPKEAACFALRRRRMEGASRGILNAAVWEFPASLIPSSRPMAR